MRFKFSSLFLLVSTAMSIVALGQEESSPGVFNPDLFSPLSRLRDPEIQALLKLDEKQTKTLAEIQLNWELEFKEFSDLPKEQQDRNKLDAMLSKFEKEAAGILSSDQRKSVVQLTTLTYFGIHTLHELRKETYRIELALTEQQTDLINSLYRKWLQDGLTLLNQPEHKEKKRLQQLPTVQSFNEEWNSKITDEVSSTFSAEQRERFDQLEFQSHCLISSVRVFADPSVQDELKFTAEQCQTVVELIENLPDVNGEIYRATAEGYEKCVRMLDEKQLATFKSKLGKLSERNKRLLPTK